MTAEKTHGFGAPRVSEVDRAGRAVRCAILRLRPVWMHAVHEIPIDHKPFLRQLTHFVVTVPAVRIWPSHV